MMVVDNKFYSFLSLTRKLMDVRVPFLYSGYHMNALLLIIIISFDVEKLCMLSDPARIIPFMCMNLCPKNIQGRVEREAIEDDKSHYLSLLMLLPV